MNCEMGLNLLGQKTLESHKAQFIARMRGRMRKHSLAVHFILSLVQCLPKHLGWKNMKYFYKNCRWRSREELKQPWEKAQKRFWEWFKLNEEKFNILSSFRDNLRCKMGSNWHSSSSSATHQGSAVSKLNTNQWCHIFGEKKHREVWMQLRPTKCGK